MIDFICKLIFFPFTLMAYMFKFIGYFWYAMIMVVAWCIQGIVNLIKFLVSLFSKKKYKPRYVNFTLDNHFKDNVKRNNKNSGKSDFDKEADLWGLSREDRRIAKEERMSPADYIEAEERDDDELDTDEWE